MSALSLGISLAALMVSVVAAIGTIWQAHIAEALRKSGDEASWPMIEWRPPRSEIHAGVSWFMASAVVSNRSDEIWKCFEIQAPFGFRVGELVFTADNFGRGVSVLPVSPTRYAACDFHVRPEARNTVGVLEMAGFAASWPTTSFDVLSFIRWVSATVQRRSFNSLRISLKWERTGHKKTTVTTMHVVTLPAARPTPAAANNI
jgi:hypothetical protein